MLSCVDMKRVRLRFASKLEVEFIDRDKAVKHVYELGEKGTRYPLIVLVLKAAVNRLGLGKQLKFLRR
jgi:hypothetical protein